MPGLPLFPDSASTVSTQVDLLFLLLVGVSALVVILIGGLIVYFSVKYRRRSEDEVPEQIVGSNRLELAWTVIPLGFFMLVFFWGASIYMNMSQPPSNSMHVYVVAKQWLWKFQHASGQSEIDELHVPVGRPVELTMISQDVIHSLFVPEFRIKQDVLPERYTTTWFQATKAGTYHLFCTQYCGTNHAEMTGSIIVMDPAAFEQWLSGGPTAAQSPAAAGQALFQQLGCAGCHLENGRGPGPSLVGVYGSTVKLQGGGTVVADDSYIRESILDPGAKVVEGYQPIMPSFRGRVTEEQIIELIAYIKSLGAQPAGATTPGATTPGAATPGAATTPSGTAPVPTPGPTGTP